MAGLGRQQHGGSLPVEVVQREPDLLQLERRRAQRPQEERGLRRAGQNILKLFCGQIS